MTGVPANAIEITDPADERIADYRALTDVELRTRWEPPHGLFIAEGELVLRRAAAGRVSPSDRYSSTPSGSTSSPSCRSDGAPVYAATPGRARSGDRIPRPPRACSPSFHRRALPTAADDPGHRPAGGDPGGRQQSHESRGDVPRCGGPRHGCRAAVAVVRGPALPPQRPGEHGGGVRDPVREAGAVAAGARDGTGRRVHGDRDDAGG